MNNTEYARSFYFDLVTLQEKYELQARQSEVESAFFELKGQVKKVLNELEKLKEQSR